MLKKRRLRKKKYKRVKGKIIPKNASKSNKLVTKSQVVRLIKSSKEPKYLKNAYECVFDSTTLQNYSFFHLTNSGNPHIESAPKGFIYMSPGISANANKWTTSGSIRAKYRETNNIILDRISTTIVIRTGASHFMPSDLILKWYIVQDAKNNILTNPEFLCNFGTPYSYYAKSTAQGDFPTETNAIKILKRGTIRIKQYKKDLLAPGQYGIIGKPTVIRRTMSYKFGKTGKSVRFQTGGQESAASIDFGTLGRLSFLTQAIYEDGSLIEEGDSITVKPQFNLYNTTYFKDKD